MQVMIDVDILKNFMKENKMSKCEFCKKCKISTLTFQKILNKSQSIRFNTIFKIARSMNIKTNDFLNTVNVISHTQNRDNN